MITKKAQVLNLLSNPFEEREEVVWYEDNKKDTGIFFSKQLNTWHKIENHTGKTRYIAYETLHINQLMSG